MGISLKNISRLNLFFNIFWLLTLVIPILLIQNAGCVSTESIPFPSGRGNNWTAAAATSNEAEYVIDDTDEELFLMKSQNHQYYNNFLAPATNTISNGALRGKPICDAIRYQPCIEQGKTTGVQDSCGFEGRRCRPPG
ncbi:hypothetical protein ACH5RR_034834 [Cinchona calisaya]|uniref:Rapid ALkalinization Factor n=1 Tax=Cinchona calisaya TaxID=153742 RepID=A0ABD2YHG4_9GENT